MIMSENRLAASFLPGQVPLIITNITVNRLHTVPGQGLNSGPLSRKTGVHVMSKQGKISLLIVVVLD